MLRGLSAVAHPNRPSLALVATALLTGLVSNSVTLLSATTVLDWITDQRTRAVLARSERVAALQAAQTGLAPAALAGFLQQELGGVVRFLPADDVADGRPDAALPGDVRREVERGRATVHREVMIGGKTYLAAYQPVFAGSGALAGVFLLGADKGAFATVARNQRNTMVGTSIITVILLSYIPFGISSWFARQIDERESRLEEARCDLDTALTHMTTGLCVYDRESRLTICNPRFCEIFGFPPDRVRPGTTYNEILRLSFALGNYPGRTVADVLAEKSAVAARRERLTYQQVIRDGRVLQVQHEPMSDGGWLITHEDVTERVRAHEQIAYAARHDPLTGALNRAAFATRLDQELAAGPRHGWPVLLYIDLDRFKEINDSFGHPTGDRLLQIAAERLRRCVRGSDIVCRLGGDEFAILHLGGASAAEVAALAQKAAEALNGEFEVFGQTLRVGSSVGAAAAPDDGADPERLMASADAALYLAKRSGRGTFCVFGPDLHRRTQARKALEAEIQAGLAQGEFEVWYQPVCALSGARVRGFEALLRWRHSRRGLVPPLEFVPVAEEAGLITPLGEWMLRQACAAASCWPDHLYLAVNLSPVQLRARGLAESVLRVLTETGLAPGRLEIEVTETAIIQDTEAAFETLSSLQAAGVRIALDDFGTGYSSLSFLTQFRFNRIKIDRSFIQDMESKPDSTAIVETVVALARRIGLSTTAEGVETEEQYRRMAQIGCDEAQGYLLGRPAPLARIASAAPAFQPAGPGETVA